MNEIWILGATGRTGRAVAAKLVTMQVPVVLVGRDETRLRALAHNIGGEARVLVADSVDAMKAEIARGAPSVVFNTIGPFAQTALPIARACLPTTHYVDVSNEFSATAAILDLNNEAIAAGQTLVGGAGFGVTATESVVLKLCEDRPAPKKVRVDAMASLEVEAGTIGAALAATIAEVITFGGRQVRGGRLVRSRSASDAARLKTPDGEAIGTASGASAELLAAWRASNAEFVVAASSIAPTGIGARLVLPVVSTLFRVPGFGAFATGQIARIPMKAQARPRPDSWAHARAMAKWRNPRRLAARGRSDGIHRKRRRAGREPIGARRRAARRVHAGRAVWAGSRRECGRRVHRLGVTTRRRGECSVIPHLSRDSVPQRRCYKRH